MCRGPDVCRGGTQFIVIIFLAGLSSLPIPFVKVSVLKLGEAIHPFAKKRLSTVRQSPSDEGVPAIILRDDYNPMDSYDLGLREANRGDILQTTDWEILAR